jgi:hypothetical protein
MGNKKPELIYICFEGLQLPDIQTRKAQVFLPERDFSCSRISLHLKVLKFSKQEQKLRFIFDIN